MVEVMKIVVKVKVKSLSQSNSWRPHGLQPTRLLRPWDFPGKNTGVGCHFLLQGIFLTQGLNPSLWLLLWQADSLPLSHLGDPHTTRDLSQKAEKLGCLQIVDIKEERSAPALLVLEGLLKREGVTTAHPGDVYTSSSRP